MVAASVFLEENLPVLRYADAFAVDRRLAVSPVMYLWMLIELEQIPMLCYERETPGIRAANACAGCACDLRSGGDRREGCTEHAHNAGSGGMGAGAQLHPHHAICVGPCLKLANDLCAAIKVPVELRLVTRFVFTEHL